MVHESEKYVLAKRIAKRPPPNRSSCSQLLMPQPLLLRTASCPEQKPGCDVDEPSDPVDPWPNATTPTDPEPADPNTTAPIEPGTNATNPCVHCRSSCAPDDNACHESCEDDNGGPCGPPASAEEALEWADTNGDGEVAWDELVYVYEQRSGRSMDNVTQAAWERVFSASDGDGSSALNMTELAAFMQEMDELDGGDQRWHSDSEFSWSHYRHRDERAKRYRPPV